MIVYLILPRFCCKAAIVYICIDLPGTVVVDAHNGNYYNQ